ncbi:MAG: hypothetical protein COA45_02860 [Zetaproteobacteria bacterium]|nr:MAG: hypothetical protein COA45_02860 [Zetaproteobacteria bacterium]
MAENLDNIKEEIETLFNARVDECSFERDFVLKVRFSELTDIFDKTFKGYNGVLTAQKVQQAVLDLQVHAPVIIFENCEMFSAKADSNLSDNPDERGNIGAHFFHRDFFGFGEKEDAPSSFLFNPLNVDRKAPTYYALVESVKEAVDKLSQKPPYSSEKSQVGLKELSSYGYTDRDSDHQVMQFINVTLGHEFTQAVFDEMPDKDKISIQWKQDENIVVMQSNLLDVAHARPALGDNRNDMSAIDLI